MTDKPTNLSSALGGGGNDNFDDLWNLTEAAGEHMPLPKGKYVCHITEGKRIESRQKGTPGYQLTFKVIEGEFKDRKVKHSMWLTPAALPMTKRDLAKLGITSPKQMSEPIPPGIRCNVRIACKTSDEDDKYNEVRDFEFVAVDKVEPDPFDTDDEHPEIPV